MSPDQTREYLSEVVSDLSHTVYSQYGPAAAAVWVVAVGGVVQASVGQKALGHIAVAFENAEDQVAAKKIRSAAGNIGANARLYLRNALLRFVTVDSAELDALVKLAEVAITRVVNAWDAS